MKYLFLVGVLSLPTFASSVIEPKIVGGVTTSANEIPWQLFLQATFSSGDFVCGATYIGNQYAITAAHCVTLGSASSGTASSVTLYGGNTSTAAFGTSSGISATFEIHPSYSSSSSFNDIAVLRLASAPPSNVKAMKIATVLEQEAADEQFRNEYNASGISPANLLVSGWGKTAETGNVSTSLRHTLLTGVPDSTCRAEWADTLNMQTSLVVCASMPDPSLVRDSCQGDSGGPLIWQNPTNASDDDFGFRLLGAVSFGIGCESVKPGAYTEVAAYTSFINLHTENLPTTTSFDVNPFTNRDFDDVGGTPSIIFGDGDGSSFSFWWLGVAALAGIGRIKSRK